MILLKSCLLRKNFDFHRNSRPTVLMYADRHELLGFRNFFNSLLACRKGFFDTLKSALSDTAHFFDIEFYQPPKTLSRKPAAIAEPITPATFGPMACMSR